MWIFKALRNVATCKLYAVLDSKVNLKEVFVQDNFKSRLLWEQSSLNTKICYFSWSINRLKHCVTFCAHYKTYCYNIHSEKLEKINDQKLFVMTPIMCFSLDPRQKPDFEALRKNKDTVRPHIFWKLKLFQKQFLPEREKGVWIDGSNLDNTYANREDWCRGILGNFFKKIAPRF